MVRLASSSIGLVAIASIIGAACGGSKCDDCGAGGAATTTSTTTFTSEGGSGGTGGGTVTSTTFPCKGLECERGSEVCTVTSVNLQNETGECTPLPAACADPAADCACFGDLMGCQCTKQITGDFALFCDVTN